MNHTLPLANKPQTSLPRYTCCQAPRPREVVIRQPQTCKEYFIQSSPRTMVKMKCRGRGRFFSRTTRPQSLKLISELKFLRMYGPVSKQINDRWHRPSSDCRTYELNYVRVNSLQPREISSQLRSISLAELELPIQIKNVAI